MTDFGEKIEILAPVGGMEQLTAAVRSGADAVYFGAGGFNARRNAENFADEEFLSAVKYCRERNVKAYITLNTLITDREIPEFINTLRLIAKSGADAVIVQDLAAVSLVKKYCPTLPLHASTQMAVHNVNGAKMLEKLGFVRVVPARELSFREIKKIAESTDLEIEVFVHGAHCMSASGMCYMSSALGDRSGNRGLCAQPCRLNFKTENREYALSLKDMCLIEHTDELKKAGVCSFKIEGRMKRPEYVAAAVSEYKKAVNGEKADISTLKSIFSRSGFTDGYFTGKRTADMFGFRTKDDVISAQNVFQPLQALYKDEKKSVGITMDFFAAENEKSRLEVSDNVHKVTVFGDVPEKAIKRSMDNEYAEKYLLKLGSTPYFAEQINCEISDGLSLSASSLNALRRAAVEQLTAKRGKTDGYYFNENPEKEEFFELEKPEKVKLRLRFESLEQMPEKITADKIILPLRELEKHGEILEKYKENCVAEIPVLLYPDDEERVKNLLFSLKEKGLRFALCENIAAVNLSLDSGLTPLGGMMLGVLNSLSLNEYKKMGVEDITFSSEMSFSLMKNIKRVCKTGFIGYMHAPLMRFRCCPLKTEKGCGNCNGRQKITDRKGYEFTVLCSEKKYQTLLNPVPVYTGNKDVPETDFVTLYFTRETKTECEKIVDMFINRKTPDFKRTMGVYNKELK